MIAYVAALIIACIWGCFALARRAHLAKWRVSIRGLLVMIGMIAVLLAAIIGYRRAATVRVVWLDPKSDRAKQMFPVAEDLLDFTYYARNRSVRKLPHPHRANITNARWNVSNITYGEECIHIQALDESTAVDLIQAFRDADKLPDGSFVIRGRVRDNRGNPLSNANVDILGSFVFVNCFKTRDDGTFTLALTDENAGVPEASGYYFRIRAAGDSAKNPVRWNSGYFSLSHSNPEMVVDIAVPEH